MEDKELLKLAAKAAGLEFSDGRALDPTHYIARDIGSTSHDWDGWNPLIRDRDAFRLAVKLGLVLNLSPREDCRGQTVVTYHGVCKVEEPCYEGRDVAARRAIVRVAAELAKLAAAQPAGQEE